jgi:hypothetical protein
MLQAVQIEWHPVRPGLMPKQEGTYLIAFDDMTVETYPLTTDDIMDGEVRAGRSIGLYWATSIPHPDED